MWSIDMTSELNPAKEWPGGVQLANGHGTCFLAEYDTRLVCFFSTGYVRVWLLGTKFETRYCICESYPHEPYRDIFWNTLKKSTLTTTSRLWFQRDLIYFHTWLMYVVSNLTRTHTISKCPWARHLSLLASWLHSGLGTRNRGKFRHDKPFGLAWCKEWNAYCVRQSYGDYFYLSHTVFNHGIQGVTRVMTYVDDAVTLWRCLQQCVLAALN
jgi:hypothetical protein